MSNITLRVPDSVHEQARNLARSDGISVNSFYASAAAEKIAAMRTVEYLREEAARSTPSDFLRVLNMAPKVPPAPEDVLPARTPAPQKTPRRRAGSRPLSGHRRKASHA
ncbi:HicB family protein [Opitutaceae bacterium TAV1]|nr:pilus biosynthesis protein HicB [Opitutaceae bacterium TAV5]EIQ01279.1 HicB family protein [Opitutaceae bacterium TAV1]